MLRQSQLRLLATAFCSLLMSCSGSAPPAGAVAQSADPAQCQISGTEANPPPIKHLFTIVLENKGYDEIYGPGSPAAYLRDELTQLGQHLPNVYGTAHASTGNYIALISGQGPNALIHGDCAFWAEFPDTTKAEYGQLVGQGCVFPTSVPNIADELELAGYSWKGYMQDMALEKSGGTSSPTGACVHPDVNTEDATNSSDAEEQYATRHNPFLFFHSIIDDPERCIANDVDLEVLRDDLKSYETTPNYSFIVPDNCNNAHDAECSDGGAGGLERANEFLKEWVPLIMASPAYQQDGMMIIMFDEANPGGTNIDYYSACCGQEAHPGPNTILPGLVGPGGGRYGAVVLSPFTKPGSVNMTPYNHYSLLRTAQDLFNAKTNGYLGFAGLPASEGMHAFGEDVYNCGGAAKAAPVAGAGRYGGAFGALGLLMFLGVRLRRSGLR